MTRERILELGPDRSLLAVSNGEGRDIVLLHGALTTHHDWLSGPFESFARRGRATAVDRPGHGESRRPRFEGTPKDQARQIKSGLERLGIERAVLVGHSFGGLVALHFAQLFPETVTAMVLAAPLVHPEPRLLEHLLLAPRAAALLGPWLSSAAVPTIDPPLLRMIQQRMFAPEPVPPRWQQSFPYDRVLDPDAMVFEGEDMAAILPGAPAGLVNLATIHSPVFVVAGSADRIVNPLHHSGALRMALPDVEVKLIEGAGHMVHHSHPDALLEALDQALAVDADQSCPR